MRRFLKYEIHSFRIALISSFIGFVFMVIAFSTTSWTEMRYTLINKDNKSLTTSIHEHYGIWWYCITHQHILNGKKFGNLGRFCTKSDLLVTHMEFSERYHGNSTSEPSQGYFKSRAVFNIMALLLMALTISFNIYSICTPRYTIKRLTAVLYLMSAISSFMSIEMSLEVIKLHESRLNKVGAQNLKIMYGYSFTLNCLAFIIFIICDIIFIAFCSKIKPKEGPQHEEEEKAAETDAPLVLY